MLSSVLRSKRAIQVNIAIMRTFVRLRAMLATHKGLADKLALLSADLNRHWIEFPRVFTTAIGRHFEALRADAGRRVGNP